jgi:DNA-binding NarL/FixJ family response regulator
VRELLDSESDFRVVADAADGAEAVRRALEGDVDLAILDVAMPRMTGLQAAQEPAARRPALRLLVLSMHENEQFVFEALLRDPPRADRALGTSTTRRANTPSSSPRPFA